MATLLFFLFGSLLQSCICLCGSTADLPLIKGKKNMAVGWICRCVCVWGSSMNISGGVGKTESKCECAVGVVDW